MTRTDCSSWKRFISVLTIVGSMVGWGASSAEAQFSEARAFFEPRRITDNEQARLAVSGPWSDGCTPQWKSTEVVGSVIQVHAETPGGVGCSLALTSFGWVVDIGPLDPGDYRFEIYLTDLAADPAATPELWINTGLLVVEDAPDQIPLREGRFIVDVTWEDFDGQSEAGRVFPTTSAETGFFWFFSPDNIELMVKVLDGCAINGHYWVFGSASTTVGYSIRVTDTTTAEQWTFDNPLGEASPAIADTEAFATCP